MTHNEKIQFPPVFHEDRLASITIHPSNNLPKSRKKAAHLSYTTLDVFTQTRYTGNPLAIVTIPAQHRSTLTHSQKQDIAKEFNLSETVFLHQSSSEGDTADDVEVAIDIFTPLAEVPFAGHPTIGTAYYILHSEKLQNVKALRTKAGRIPISLSLSPDSYSTHGNGKMVRASIPHNIHIHTSPGASANDLNNSPYGSNNHPVVSIVKGMTFILVRLPDLAALAQTSRGIKQRPYEPEELDEGWNQGFTGTYFYLPQPIVNNNNNNDGRYRQVLRTRMHGSREDPATGSAASALSCYLALQEPRGLGKGPFRYRIVQGVEMGRRSEIDVEVTRSREGDAVVDVGLGGAAVGVMEGRLEADVDVEWEMVGFGRNIDPGRTPQHSEG